MHLDLSLRCTANLCTLRSTEMAYRTTYVRRCWSGWGTTCFPKPGRQSKFKRFKRLGLPDRIQWQCVAKNSLGSNGYSWIQGPVFQIAKFHPWPHTRRCFKKAVRPWDHRDLSPWSNGAPPRRRLVFCTCREAPWSFRIPASSKECSCWDVSHVWILYVVVYIA